MRSLKRLFKNKFFLAAVCVALALSVCTAVLAFMGVPSPLKNIFGTLATPFRWCAAQISEGLEGYTVYFRKIDGLVEKNKQLEEENASLREQLAEAEAAAREDKFLRDFIGLEVLVPEMKLLDAAVIGRESGSYRTVYNLARGSLHGVRVGMPVLSERGVVGYVSEVGLTWCSVLSIIESTSSVGVYTLRGCASGLLEGNITLREKGLCRMTLIDEEADIEVGDLVVTSGMGSIYPSGLTVGEIVALEPDEYSRTLTATVKPAADLGELSYVMILTEYKIIPYTESETAPAESEVAQ